MKKRSKQPPRARELRNRRRSAKRNLFAAEQQTRVSVMSSADDIQKIADDYYRREFRRNAGKLERDIWIAVARACFRPSERQPCFVCGRFRGITQAHHVVPLTAQYDRGFEYPDNEHVWLCPNHHAILHLFILGDNRSLNPSAMRRRSKSTSPLHPDLTEVEFDKIMELLRRSCRSA
jgi:hypothetical protein